eukprot:7798210-Pyramimonas_sp.AAC.1
MNPQEILQTTCFSGQLQQPFVLAVLAQLPQNVLPRHHIAHATPTYHGAPALVRQLLVKQMTTVAFDIKDHHGRPRRPIGMTWGEYLKAMTQSLQRGTSQSPQMSSSLAAHRAH